MGLFNLPEPFFDLVDGSLATLPPLLRLILWAIAGAAVSLALYRWLSPQRRIAEAKVAAQEARRRLNAHEGDLETALPLMRQSMKLALRHVGLVFPAALIASLPVLALLVWLDGAYGYQFPENQQAPTIAVEPQTYSAEWQPSRTGGQIALRDDAGAEVTRLTLAQPITRIEKRHWWNLLVGNPAGYLPDNGPIEGVSIGLPERQYLPVGPDWLRSWLTVALSALVIASLLIMRVARIS
ncbi:hypothetical protein [Dongia deserti]|uniref:hypothetical protein n=1 Tax=Dongia deserti TaxID=2268030 RepID=UPI000E65E1F7|nr:hypothetical protein [Dongia deserti]